jgi:hypothetical protein
MINFCTLFNSNYLIYGLSLYDSLKKNCPSFHLYIYAFDDATYDYFFDKQLPNITVVKLENFEDNALLNIKNSRTFGEYCWTCTPSIIRHAIQSFKLDICTYVDADLYFFSNPQPLFEEMGDKSVLITEHRYSIQYNQSVASGIYCVQFMVFKNTEKGMAVLEWWRNACIDWCYNRFEDGKFGDQKYLDDWLVRFDTVHSLKHLGGGVAPWNVQQYHFKSIDDKIFGIEKNTEKEFKLIFYHFHDLKYFENNVLRLTNEIYIIPVSAINHIYKKYLKKSLYILYKENTFTFASRVPKNYFTTFPLISDLTKLKIQYFIDTLKLKQFFRLFTGGNYYPFTKFK